MTDRLDAAPAPGSDGEGDGARRRSTTTATYGTIGLADPVDRTLANRIGRAWIEMRRGASTTSFREFMVNGEEPSLEQGQTDALELLSRRPRTMRGLAERLRIDPSSATRTVQRLVDVGLVERYASPDDGRVVMVRLTQAGRDKRAAVDGRRTALMRELLNEFDPTELGDLADLLDRFVQSLDRISDRIAEQRNERDGDEVADATPDGPA